MRKMLTNFFSNPATFLVGWGLLGFFFYMFFFRKIELNGLAGPSTWILAGALIGAFGSLAASINQDNESKDQKRKLQKLNDDIIRDYEKLNILNQQIIDNLEKIKNLQTGGDSYPYCEHLVLPNDPENIYFHVTHAGEYPLLNLIVVGMPGEYERVPVSKLTEEKARELQGNVKAKEIGTLHPNDRDLIGPFKNNLKDFESSFHFKMHANNGAWYQKTLFRAADNKVKYVAYILFKKKNERLPASSNNIIVLKEYISEGFPIKKGQRINWDLDYDFAGIP